MWTIRPEFIYFKTLFHVFEKFPVRAGEQAQFFDNTAITDTEIWKALFDFQKDGVKGRHSENQHPQRLHPGRQRGLGKTYSALAVIKYFELRNHRVCWCCAPRSCARTGRFISAAT
jgi:hypothetical protein